MKTQQLLNTINQYGNKEIGQTYINKNGIPYRYELTRIAQHKIQNWMVSLFRAAQIESVGGKGVEKSFWVNDMHFIKTQGCFKNDPVREISMNILVKYPNN